MPKRGEGTSSEHCAKEELRSETHRRDAEVAGALMLLW
jgi:hypothetical protein